ncbi:MAG: long-chain fatty acid--CoA ligase [Actinomycetota bacterium]|nr:long-chain fatty acid--CoA ligase [Actinomycetota bacterium]
MNAGELLANTARSYPEQVAWIWDDRIRTYGETDARADAFAHELVGLGLRRGDRIAMLMENRPEVMEAMFGAWKAAMVAAPLNARFTAAEIEFHVNDAGSRVLVVGEELAATVAAMRDRLPTVEHVIQVNGEPLDGFAAWDEVMARGAASDRGPFEPVTVDDDELAWLAYTSGTTGKPKGAMLTHGVLVFEVLGMLADFFPLETGQVGIHAAPLTHGSGHVGLVFVTKACAQVILSRHGFDVARFLELVERHRVNALFLVPTMIKMIVDHPDVATRDLSSLQWVFYGGSPMYVDDLRRAQKTLGNIFIQGFGQTESPMTGTVLPAAEHDPDGPLAHRLASCGRARAGISVRILGDDDEPLPTGEIGEICIRGGTVMKGYWQRPEETAETLRNGWLHTGDLGRMDDDGYVYILDRSKDMVISGGLNVYPREIEEVLLTHPSVSEACVFGAPDDKWGEALVAHLVLVGGSALTADEVIAFMAERVAGYKKPKRVVFVDELAKTPYGKVDKKAIRAPYWEGRDRLVG